MGEDQANDAATDGGNVAEAREPETIQRDIEQTRAELAEAIDAIADRISPRRAASRGAAKVRSGVQSMRNRDDGAGTTAVLDLAAAEATGPGSHVPDEEFRYVSQETLEASPGGGLETRRVLRTDRVLLAGGLFAVVVAIVVLLRRRRG